VTAAHWTVRLALGLGLIAVAATKLIAPQDSPAVTRELIIAVTVLELALGLGVMLSERYAGAFALACGALGVAFVVFSIIEPLFLDPHTPCGCLGAVRLSRANRATVNGALLLLAGIRLRHVRGNTTDTAVGHGDLRRKGAA
jgi:hypothetical protein